MSTRNSLGSGKSDHLLNPVNTSKINKDSIYDEIQFQLNRIKSDIEYLKSNLFVYNESSCPVRLQKYIRERLELSPEDAAILLPDVIGFANKNKKSKNW